MIHSLLGMAAVLAALGVLLAALALYRHAAAPHPELVRKLLHIGMGLVTLSFPWLFDAAWAVVVLACLSLLLMISLRLVAPLRDGVGRVVAGVSRSSLGEVYFPLAVCVLWLLYVSPGQEPGRRLLGYLIPVLLLTLSDASAALVGVAYGQLRYHTPDGTKTHEGSVAFFLCSFLCAHVPLLLLADLGRAETLLIALLLAWLATLFEAIAWGGLDNLVLPLIAYLLLTLYWDLTVGALLTRIAAMGLLSAAVLVLAWWTPLRGSAVVGAALVGYVCWALGDWRWVVPPLVLFVGYVTLACRNPPSDDSPHTIHAVVCVASAGMVWLLLARFRHRPEWFYPFTVAFAANLGMIATAQLLFVRPKVPPLAAVAVCAAGAWLAVLGPYALMQQAIIGPALALPVVAAAVAAFALVQPRMCECPADTPRWLRQAACALAASGLAALLA